MTLLHRLPKQSGSWIGRDMVFPNRQIKAPYLPYLSPPWKPVLLTPNSACGKNSRYGSLQNWWSCCKCCKAASHASRVTSSCPGKDFYIVRNWKHLAVPRLLMVFESVVDVVVAVNTTIYSFSGWKQLSHHLFASGGTSWRHRNDAALVAKAFPTYPAMLYWRVISRWTWIHEKRVLVRLGIPAFKCVRVNKCL